MSKLTLVLIVGGIAMALTGAAQADTKLRIGNGMTTITIPSNSNIRAQATEGARADRTSTRTYFGSWNGAGPGIQN